MRFYLMLFCSFCTVNLYKNCFSQSLTSLSQRSNHFISTDSYGLTWISSIDGVNVFDGIQTRVYRPGTHNMVGCNIQSKFFEDCDHNIWFSSYNALHKYVRNRDDFQVYQFRDTTGRLITDSYKVLHTTNGFVILRFGDYIGIVDINTDVLVKYFHLSLMNDRYFSVWENDENLNIVCADNHQVFQIKWNQYLSKPPVKIKLFSENNVTDVVWKNQHSILYSQNNFSSIKEYNLQSKLPSVYYTHSGPVRNFTFDPSSYLLVLDDGITTHLLHPDSKKIIYSQIWPPDMQGNSSPINISGNIIWQCVDGKGIRFFQKNKNKFRHHRFPIDGHPANARSIIQSHEGSYWYSSRDYGIGRFDILGNHLGHYNTKNGKAPSDFVLQLTPLSNGNLLATGGEKISLYHKKSDSFIPLQLKNKELSFFTGSTAKVSDSLIFCVNYLDFKNIYQIRILSGNSFELAKIKVSGILSRDEIVHVFSSFSQNLILNINTTDVALATLENKNFTIKKRYHINASVNHVLPFGDSLYLSTNNGLFIVDKNLEKTPVKIEDQQNLLSQNIYCAILHKNDIYLSTNKGLISYSKKTGNAHLFSLSDGIQDYEFNSTAAFQDENGTMFFGGVNGINIFHPDSIVFLQHPAKIHISEILINDEKNPRYIDANGIDKLTLNYTQNTVTFRFNGIDYADPTTIKLRYQLVDYDKNAIEADNENGLARYANLPPGDYTFEIFATNADGIWNKHPRLLKLSIDPPFWLTWWFRLMVVLLAVGSGYGIVRSYYKRKIAKKNQLLREQALIIEKQTAVEAERTRIATEMHDDLGSGLTKIRYLSERALKNTADPEEIAQIKTIADQSNTLVSNMSEIIWALNSRFDTTENLIGYLRRYIVEYLDDHHIAHTLETFQNRSDIPVTGEKRRNIFLVLKEILHNAVKYAQADILEISITADDQLIIDVFEKGNPGFDPEQSIEKGNGIYNMTKRMSAIGGQITFQRKENGMFISFSCPLNSQS